jgi:hypothetical protein
MLVQLKSLFLHAPLFVGGRNLKDKIYASAEIQLVLNTEINRVLVKHNNEVVLVPEASSLAEVPLNQDHFKKMFENIEVVPQRPKTHVAHASKLDIKDAQVSDPSTTVQNPR